MRAGSAAKTARSERKSTGNQKARFGVDPGSRSPANRKTGSRLVGCDQGPGLIKLEKFPRSGLSSPQLERFAIQQLRSSLCRKLTRLGERRQCAPTNGEYQNEALIGWFDEAVNQTRGRRYENTAIFSGRIILRGRRKRRAIYGVAGRYRDAAAGSRFDSSGDRVAGRANVTLRGHPPDNRARRDSSL